MHSLIPRNNELQKKRWTLKHFNVCVLSLGTQSILLLNVKVPPYVQEGTKAKTGNSVLAFKVRTLHFQESFDLLGIM